MAKSDDTGGSSSKVNTTGDNKYGKNKKSPKIGGLNPSNIYLATKYDDNTYSIARKVRLQTNCLRSSILLIAKKRSWYRCPTVGVRTIDGASRAQEKDAGFNSRSQQTKKGGSANPMSFTDKNKVPEELVCLHFDDLIMKALKLTPKKPK
ncbi:CiV14g2-like-3 protein [Chelonus insularis]|nr:CiV14g2-like-3 protein [Chelonus insularis]